MSDDIQCPIRECGGRIRPHVRSPGRPVDTGRCDKCGLDVILWPPPGVTVIELPTGAKSEAPDVFGQ